MISVSGFNAWSLAILARMREAFALIPGVESFKNFSVRSFPFSPNLLSSWRVSSLTLRSSWTTRFPKYFNADGIPNLSEDVNDVADKEGARS